jgi:hypothetical protein
VLDQLTQTEYKLNRNEKYFRELNRNEKTLTDPTIIGTKYKYFFLSFFDNKNIESKHKEKS